MIGGMEVTHENQARLVEVVQPSSPKNEPASPGPAGGTRSPNNLATADTPVHFRTPSPNQSRSFFDPPSPQNSSSRSSFSPALSLGSPTLPSISSSSRLFQPYNSLLHKPLPLKRPSLPFSIDNILRPSFGPSLLLHHMVAAVAAAAAVQSQEQLAKQHQEQELLRCPRSSTIKTESESPLVVSRPTVPAAPVQPKINQQPVDLSSKSANGITEKNGLAGKDDKDVPPGMVRGPNGQLWPAWVFCTRYSDRPSSGPRLRKIKKPGNKLSTSDKSEKSPDSKRPRTAFSGEQLARLKKEFEENRYLTEERRKNLADELGLHENQIKIWFQNKRAKIKKTSGDKGELARMLAAQGLYNHSTVAIDEDDYPDV